LVIAVIKRPSFFRNKISKEEVVLVKSYYGALS